MALFDTTAFRIIEQGMSVMWTKQQIIAQNITNQDTPDYNCKYLDFGGILKDKIRADGSIKKELNIQQRLVIDTYTDDQADGNNVDMDVQSAEASKTAYWLDALINQMNGNFTRIRSAIVTK
ncbi:MAG: flagellar basal body rod protein FlgB [Oscillospiraceae bacterium]|nr:flagellar basal body rod protein FlgB [Oscillospiraceae bacterium]